MRRARRNKVGLGSILIPSGDSSNLSPPADFVGPALELAAFGAGFAQALEVAAAELDRDALDVVAAELLDGDFLARRIGAPETSDLRQKLAPLRFSNYSLPRPPLANSARPPAPASRPLYDTGK